MCTAYRTQDLFLIMLMPTPSLMLLTVIILFSPQTFWKWTKRTTTLRKNEPQAICIGIHYHHQIIQTPLTLPFNASDILWMSIITLNMVINLKLISIILLHLAKSRTLIQSIPSQHRIQNLNHQQTHLFVSQQSLHMNMNMVS